MRGIPESSEAWGISACRWTLESISSVQHGSSFPQVEQMLFVFGGSRAIDNGIQIHKGLKRPCVPSAGVYGEAMGVLGECGSHRTR